MHLSKRSGTAVAVLALLTALLASKSPRAGSAATTSTFSAPSGSSFRAEPVPKGMISEQQAISVALHYTEGAFKGHLPPGVHVRAYFGIYTDTLYSARPVWIVRFWGPGLTIYGSGGPMPRGGTPYCAPPQAHEELVIIGGKTGKYLEADVGLIPEGLPTVVTTPEPVPTPCPTRPPHGITPSTVGVGLRGDIFIGGRGDRFTGEVQKRSPAGKLLFSWSNSAGRGSGHQVNHLALDHGGDVYLADDDNIVQKFNTRGHLVWTYPRKGPKIGGSASLWTMAVAPDGTAYFPDREHSKILKLSPGGRRVGEWHGRWDYLAADLHGTLYAANVANGLIEAFTPSGRPERHWLIETTPGVGVILSIATGPDGSVYVFERRQSRKGTLGFEVARYSPEGRLTGRLRVADGVGRHQLNDPTDLAVGPRGTIFIADRGNPRLSAISLAGGFRAEWQL